MTTTGEFTTLPLSKIVVNRDARQRRELNDIDDLARSIAQRGLIHPPVVTRDYVLVTGERRVTAMRSLGWTSTPVQFVEDMDDVGLHLLELDENIKREDISWQEQCLAYDKYYELRKTQDRYYNGNKMCQELNISNSKLSQYFLVAKELKGGNKRVLEAEMLSTATSVARREVDRRNATAIASAVARPGDVAPPKPEKVVPLLQVDFGAWLDSYEGEPFNLIHCDFPYGVGMHNSDQGGGKSFGTYSDKPEDFTECLRHLERAMATVVAESSHLLFWFSMDFYHDTLKALAGMGWEVQRHPLIWHKSDNVGILSDPQRGPRRIYETCFLASRGDRKIVKPISNVSSAPGRFKDIHMNEKPQAMLQHLMGMVCDEYSYVLDPTCGSGNALKAATSLGASRVLGLERDPEFYQRAVDMYYPGETEDV